MAKKEEKKQNAKQKAYQKKQEQQGRRVVNWIFAILILLALIFAISTVSMA